MSDKDLTLAAKLMLETRSWVDGLRNGTRAHDQFRDHVESNMERINLSVERVRGTLEKFGIGLGAYELLKDQAAVTRSLNIIGVKAAGTKEELGELGELLAADARKTGAAMTELTAAASGIVTHGDDLKAIVEMTHAANEITQVWGGSIADTTAALRDMGQAFNINMTKAGTAEKLADEMSVAAARGNIDPGTLAQIVRNMGKKGVGDIKGLDATESMAWIEGLSKINSSPAVVQGLSRQVAQFFDTNQAGIEQQQRLTNLTGIRTVSKDGSRSPIDVLLDLERKYNQHSPGVGRQVYLARTFANINPGIVDTLKQIFESHALDDMKATTEAARAAVGEASRNQQSAQEDAGTQALRIKNYFLQTAELVTGPINKGLTEVIKFNTAVGEKTGMPGATAAGLTIAEILAMSAAAAAGKSVLGSVKGFAGRLLGGGASLAAGVGEGKLLQAAAGVTPVFVTNWPAGGGTPGGLPAAAADTAEGVVLGSAAGKVLKGGSAWWKILRAATVGDLATGTLGVAGTAIGAAAVGTAGAAGYGVGSVIYKAIDTTDFADKLGGVIAQAMANLGSKDAQEALDRRFNADGKVNGTLKIQIDSDGRPRVAGMNATGIDLDVSSGPFGYMFGG